MVLNLRRVCLAVLAGAILLGGALGAQADVIARDVAYWYRLAGGGLATEFNPTSQWLRDNRSSLIIKIQQTVYNPEQTREIVGGDPNWDPAWNSQDVYLFSYTVTNLNWSTASGLTAFAPEWGGVSPLLVTIDPAQTNANWKPTVFKVANGNPLDGPAWLWQPATPLPGLTIGGSVGGFWAISPYGQDARVPAVSGTGDAHFPLNLTFLPYGGMTTGPVPEPGGILALAFGVVAFASRLRRR